MDVCRFLHFTHDMLGQLQVAVFLLLLLLLPEEGRPRTAWIDNIKSWRGLSVEESIRMTKDRDKWRKYVHGVANLRIEEG